MSEALKIQIDHLAESIRELKSEVKSLNQEVNRLNLLVYEARVGRKWLFGLLSSAVLLGTFIDTILRWFKLY